MQSRWANRLHLALALLALASCVPTAAAAAEPVDEGAPCALCVRPTGCTALPARFLDDTPLCLAHHPPRRRPPPLPQPPLCRRCARRATTQTPAWSRTGSAGRPATSHTTASGRASSAPSTATCRACAWVVHGETAYSACLAAAARRPHCMRGGGPVQRAPHLGLLATDGHRPPARFHPPPPLIRPRHHLRRPTAASLSSSPLQRAHGRPQAPSAGRCGPGRA